MKKRGDKEPAGDCRPASNTSANGGGDSKNAAENPEYREAHTAEVGTQRSAASKMVAASFGEIVALLMRSPAHKHFSLADLEWMVLPPVLANQFAVAGAKAKEDAEGLPVAVGVAFWARVSPEVDAELEAGLDRPVRLRPDQWTSGDIYWLIDVVAPPALARKLVDRLAETVFANKGFKARAQGADGKRMVKALHGKRTAT